MCWRSGHRSPAADGRAVSGACPEAFELEMGCTEAEWLGWLPEAIGERAWQREGAAARVQVENGKLTLDWVVEAPRVIALLRLPRLRVCFRFQAVSEAGRYAFMKRFDLHMQRGGG